MKAILDLPNPQRRALELVREVALEKRCHPYLVGGPVRDLLLGRHAIDIDLTLEEGGSTLARALAKRINGRVRSFPQFMTYKVTAENFPEIDIATARKERYRQPGSLPAVTHGRLKDDLLRRDFTINALALGVLDETLHDPAGGEADIRDRFVRVLHERSFLDDPTRIFRAIRLATRLAFTLHPETARLMQEALHAKALATVSRERIWRELFLAMDETDAPAVLTALAESGAVASLFGHRTNGELRAKLEAVRSQFEADPGLDHYVLYTGVLLHGDASPVDFEGSGFSQKRARAVVEIANELPRFEESLAAATNDEERFRLYRSVSPEMLAIVAAELPDQAPLMTRWREFENFKLPLRGNDLEVPGGPHVARALEEARQAVWNGQIAPDEARSYARQVARRLLEEAQQ
jgi:tRNA nucleotidyltransferase/poly(A) polymerase